MQSCPWEERERIGAAAAFGETLQRSAFRPSEFFAAMPPRGRVSAALFYAVIIGTLAAAVAMMWKRILAGPVSWMPPEWDLPEVSGSLWYLGLLFMPLVIVLSAVVRSAILHFSLKILGGASENYGATLKAVSYANSASAFTVFPFVGVPLAFIWRVALIVIGLREVHRTTTGRAFFAWLLPFILVSFFVFAMLFALFIVMMKLFPAVSDFIAV